MRLPGPDLPRLSRLWFVHVPPEAEYWYTQARNFITLNIMSTNSNFQSTKIEINENKSTVTKMTVRPGRRTFYWLLLTSIEIYKQFSFVFFLFSLCRTVRFYE